VIKTGRFALYAKDLVGLQQGNPNPAGFWPSGHTNAPQRPKSEAARCNTTANMSAHPQSSVPANAVQEALGC